MRVFCLRCVETNHAVGIDPACEFACVPKRMQMAKCLAERKSKLVVIKGTPEHDRNNVERTAGLFSAGVPYLPEPLLVMKAKLFDAPM
jgi:hypothetical protein